MAKETYNFDTDPWNDFGNDGFDRAISGRSRPRSFRNLQDFTGSLLEGVGESLASENVIKNIVYKTLPRGYGRAVSDALDVASLGRELYDEARSEYGKIEDSIKQAAGEAAGQFGEYMPEGMRAWLKEYGSNRRTQYRYDPTQANNEANARILKEVFGAQLEQSAKIAASEQARDVVREGAENRYRVASSQLLSSINVGIERLGSYNDTINIGFQRKSLETQLKSYYLQTRMVEILTANQQLQARALTSLITEVQKPDILKLEQHPKTRGKYGAHARDDRMMFGNRGGELQQMLQAIRKEFKPAIRESMASIGQVIGMASLGMSTTSMMGDMGPSKYQLAGNLIGSFLPDLLTEIYGGDARRALNRYRGLREKGANLQFGLQNLRPLLAQAADNRDDLLGSGAKYLMHMIGDDRARRNLRIDSIQNINAATGWRRQDSKSLTEVIPGLLSQILQQVTMLRTGEEAPLVTYDFTRNKFSDQASVSKAVVSDMLRREGAQYVQHDVDSLINSIPGAQDLDPATRKALAKQMLRDNYNRELPSAERLSDVRTWKMKGWQAAQVSQMFKQYFEDDEFRDREIEFSDRFNQLGSNLRSHQEYFQDHVDSGLGQYLEQEGLIKEGRIDTEALLDRYIDEHIEGPLPEKERSREQVYRDITAEMLDRYDERTGNINRIRQVGKRLRRRATRSKDRAHAFQVEGRNLVRREELIKRLEMILERYDSGLLKLEDPEAVGDMIDALLMVDPSARDAKDVLDEAEQAVDNFYIESGLLSAYRPRGRSGSQASSDREDRPEATSGEPASRMGGTRASMPDIQAATTAATAAAARAAAEQAEPEIPADPTQPVTDSIEQMDQSLGSKLDESVDLLAKLTRLEEERAERERGPRKGSFEDLKARAAEQRKAGDDQERRDSRLDAQAGSDPINEMLGGMFDKAKAALGGAFGGVGELADLLDSAVDGPDGKRRRRGAGRGGRFSRMAGGFKTASQGGFRGGLATGRGAGRAAGGVASATKRGVDAVQNFKWRKAREAAGRLFSRDTLRKGMRTGRAGARAGASALRHTRAAAKVLDSFAFRAAKAGLSLGARALMFGAGIGLGVLTSPIGLAALGIGAVSAAGYGLYKWFTAPEPGEVSSYRIAQYGWPVDVGSGVYNRLFRLETVLSGNLEFEENGTARLGRQVQAGQILEALGITDFSSEEQAEAVGTWLEQRFMPVYLLHVSVMRQITKSVDLQKVDKMNPIEKERYHKGTRFENGPYDILDNPFDWEDPLVMDREAVAQVWQTIQTKLEPQAKKHAKEKPVADASTGVQAGGSDDNAAAKAAAAGLAAQAGLKPGTEEYKKFIDKQIGTSNKVDPALKSAAVNATVVGSSVMLAAQVAPDRLRADEAIRMRVYGLKEMDTTKVDALMTLEDAVVKELARDDQDNWAWEGSIPEMFNKHAAMFQAGDIGSTLGRNWVQWYVHRFLPTWLRVINTVWQRRRSTMAAQVLTQADAKLRIEVAGVATSTTSTQDGQTVSVWKLTASPWRDYELNTDPSSVVGNFKALQQELTRQTTPETTAADKKDSTPENTTSATTSSATGNNPASKGPYVPDDMGMYRSGSGTGSAGGLMGGYNEPMVAGLDGRMTGFGGGTAGSADPARFGAVGLGDGAGGLYTQIPDADTSAKGYAAYAALIDGAAQLSGVAADDLASFIGVESNYVSKAKAGTSSATGLGQFIKSTWDSMLRNYGAKYGIPMGTPPTDAKANAIMTAEYMKENARHLQQKFPGRQVDLVDLYLAHFLGAGGATNFLRADPNEIGARVFPDAARANKNVFFDSGTYQPRTIAQIRQWAANRILSVQKNLMGLPEGRRMQRNSIGQVPEPANYPTTQTGGSMQAVGGISAGQMATAGAAGALVHNEPLQSSTRAISSGGGGFGAKGEYYTDATSFEGTSAATPVTGVSGMTQSTGKAQDVDPSTLGPEATCVLNRTQVTPYGVVGRLTLPSGTHVVTLEQSPCFKPGQFLIKPATTRGRASFYAITGSGVNARLHSGNESDQPQSPSASNDILVGTKIEQRDNQPLVLGSRSAFAMLTSVLGDRPFRLIVTGGEQSAVREGGQAASYRPATATQQMSQDLSGMYGTTIATPTQYQEYMASQPRVDPQLQAAERTAEATETMTDLLTQIRDLLEKQGTDSGGGIADKILSTLKGLGDGNESRKAQGAQSKTQTRTNPSSMESTPLPEPVINPRRNL